MVLIHQRDAVIAKISLFGRQLINGQNRVVDNSDKINPCVMKSSSNFKVVWNLVLILLMIYTSLFVPFAISFYEDEMNNPILNCIIDAFFFMDIIFSFLSAYELENGREETDLKRIMLNYLTGWFVIDVIATIPSDLLELLAPEEG